ncbi:hypothetical protein G6R29_00515 [Fructobacillus sp. M2-14]|uniref:N-acetyltransferase domain-containing protein n=1 Tax=Fructobacillus broussonetiae TaxID=2713173 RepID=A0ABS5QZN0_9LACO|nr:hypothetical protein [Fructobacillus broussonetiae]MBS9338120.1 hypothetical protein [Fructobacillus broussonetiae]
MRQAQDFHLEYLKEDDYDLFRRTLQAAYRYSIPRHYGEFMPIDLLTPEEQEITDFLQAKRTSSIVAKSNGAIIAGITFLTKGDQVVVGTPIYLFTAPAFQNTGIVSKFFLKMSKQFHDIDLWEMNIYSGDHELVNLFVNRCGFEIIEFLNPHHRKEGDNSSSDSNYVLRKDNF